MLECTGLDGQNGAVWNGLMNTQRFVKEALGNQCTFFALIIRSFYCTCSEAIIWIFAVGKSGGSPILSFWMVLTTFIGARGRKETAGGRSEHQ